MDGFRTGETIRKADCVGGVIYWQACEPPHAGMSIVDDLTHALEFSGSGLTNEPVEVRFKVSGFGSK
jgi:hypothetical protein